MRRPLVFWCAGIGALAVCDVWATYNETPGDSLSECVRVVWRTHTPAGQVAFVTSWVALSAWFVPHIIRKAKG